MILKVEGVWPGDASLRGDDVAVQGRYAYVLTCAREPGDGRYELAVVDVIDPARPNRVGRCAFGEQVWQVTVLNDYAYVLMGRGLEVVDVSNPAHPVRVGNWGSGGLTGKLALSGHHAYLTGWGAGMQILDLSNPALPVRVGGFAAWPALDVAVLGNYAYVLDEDVGLRILDVSDPGRAFQVSQYPCKAPTDLAVSSAGYAYVAEFQEGLRVIDVGNPKMPMSAGFYSSGSYVSDVKASGTYAYVSETTNGLQVIDISNPTHPRRETGYQARMAVDGAAVVGDWVYAVDTWAGLIIMRMVPVSPADLPTSSFVIEAEDFDFGAGQSKTEASVMPYLGGAYQGLSASSEIDYHRNLVVLDADDYRLAEFPKVPMMLTVNESQRQRTGYEVVTSHRIGWVNEGDWYSYTRTLPPGRYTAYAACSADPAGTLVGGKLSLVTAGVGTTNQALVELGTMLAPATGAWGNNSLAPLKTPTGDPAEFTLPGGPVTLRFTTVYGDFDYFLLVPTLQAPTVVMPQTDRVVLVGASVGLEAQVGGVPAPSLQWFKDGTLLSGATNRTLQLTNVQPAAAGIYSLQAWNPAGTNRSEIAVSVVNAENQPILPLVGRWSCETGSVRSVTVQSNVAFVAGAQAGLQIIDIGNPAAPARLGQHQPVGWTEAVAVQGAYAYLADRPGGLEVIDVSDPTKPVRVGLCRTGDYPEALVVVGDYVYLADSTNGLQVIDVRIPSDPRSVGSCTNLGAVLSVAVSGGYAYAVRAEQGLTVIDVGNPQAPTPVGHCPLEGHPWNVFVSGTRAYVSAGDGGLHIVDVSNPAAPAKLATYDTVGWVECALLLGDRVLMADNPEGLRLVDVSVAASPRGVARFPLEGVGLGLAAAGEYVCLAEWRTNLSVFQLAAPPQVTQQPRDQVALVGQEAAFRLEASGTEPLTYQWYKDGVALVAATNSTLRLTDIQVSFGGLYQVSVANVVGTNTSLAAKLSVVTNLQDGLIRFANWLPEAGVDAPVMDEDGQTPLQGERYVAQLLVGADAGSLQPVGMPIPFARPGQPGYWGSDDPEWVELSGIKPGSSVWVQVRVWDNWVGLSYEASLGAGGKVGKSTLFEVVTGGSGAPLQYPAPLLGLAPFKVARIPLFLRQPESLSTYTNLSVALRPSVSSAEKVTYQWFRNDEPIAGATNLVFKLPSAQVSDGGSFYLVASNSVGSIRSRTVTVTVMERTSGGQVIFLNRLPGEGVDAPIFDVDGVTRLQGNAFVAELWAGPAVELMEAVPQQATFRTNAYAGYLYAGRDPGRVLGNVAPGETAHLQIRVWEAAAGSTYEQARAAGGKFGASEIIAVIAGGNGEPPTTPTPMYGLKPFALGQGPVIVRQPVGGLFLAGERVIIEAVVQSPTAVTVYWEKDGERLPGADTPKLDFAAIQVSQAGRYRLVAENTAGKVFSQEAVVQVRALPEGGLVRFANRVPQAGLDSPVLDLNGVTLLAGTNYVAQLFGGSEPTNLVAVGEYRPFGVGAEAGYWTVGEDYWRAIPGVAPGATAYVQVRIWEIGRGATYEEALAAGGKVVASEVWEVVTGGQGAPDPLPVLLTSLSSLQMRRLPVIVTPPWSHEVVLNRALSLNVDVSAYEPITYQWLANDIPVDGATNAVLTIPRLGANQYGAYRVLVRNGLGVVGSAVANITQKVLTSGGEIRFANVVLDAGLDAPVFNTDGVTPLQGPAFLACLYVGKTPRDLAPVTGPTSFGTGGAVISGVGEKIVLAAIPPDALVYAQMRVWEAAAGASFDQALARGTGAAGVSDIIPVVVGGAGDPPAVLKGLSSFRLAPHLASFAVLDSAHGGLALQTSTNLFFWETITVVSNVPAQLFYSQALETNAAARFYRLWQLGSNHLAAADVVGVLRQRLPPGLSMVGVPLELGDRTVGALFSDPPEGLFVYQYNAAQQQYRVNIYEFGGWSLASRPVALGEGCLVLNPSSQPYEIIWRGTVPLAKTVLTVPRGWSLMASPVPLAGELDGVFNLPLAEGDLVARYDVGTGTYLIDAYQEGWLSGRAPRVMIGEAFWIWKAAASNWEIASPAAQ